MTETTLRIDDLRALTLTCEKCGVAFTFDLQGTTKIPDACPTCEANWKDAAHVRTLTSALTELHYRNGGPLKVAFRIPATK